MLNNTYVDIRYSWEIVNNSLIGTSDGRRRLLLSSGTLFYVVYFLNDVQNIRVDEMYS